MKQMVEQGANMRFPLRWGNVFMAKFLQLLWMRPGEQCHLFRFGPLQIIN